MQSDKHYIDLLHKLKSRISESRYVAARLINREQLLLYYYIGKLLHEKITARNWGERVLSQIANDLKRQMPALRGFSARNLHNMRQLYTTYEHTQIGQLLTGQLQSAENELSTIVQSTTAQLDAPEGAGHLDQSFLSHH